MKSQDPRAIHKTFLTFSSFVILAPFKILAKISKSGTVGVCVGDIVGFAVGKKSAEQFSAKPSF